MKTSTAIALFCSTVFAALIGCGSNGGNGGDGGDDFLEVFGIWIGALTKVQDNCPGSTAPQTLNFSHQVTQVEDAVTLLDQSGLEFLGNLVGADGFSVDAAGGGIISAGQCTGTLTNRIEYHDIHNDFDDVASVEIKVTCSTGGGCEISYEGTASRVVDDETPNPTATPNPAPTASPTPVDPLAPGACSEMNPNPAAGTFSGDGGCGLSDTDFSITGSTIVLEPFGVNGASSFAVSAADPSVASSNNVDLTIKGEAGYSCSITCAPPATFFVSCFKEGGTTCTEQF